MRSFGKALAGALLLALGTAGAAAAKPSQAIENNKYICESAARHMEQVEGVPAHLLTAISLAETGRWDADKGETFAWPWTVTAEGQGHYFPTKAAAIEAVKKLKARGVGNIDVGCMQINLHYHADAFGSLDQAFDPTINIAYATGFLHERFNATGSWIQAAAAYHSFTPDKNRAYKIKVLRLWNEVRKHDATSDVASAETGEPTPTAAVVAPLPIAPGPVDVTTGDVPAPASELAATIDRARTDLLNKALEARRRGAQAIADASHRLTQLDAWRSKQFADNGQHLAIMRRAEKETERRLTLAGIRPHGAVFAENRRSQLAAWRASLPPAPNVSAIEDAGS